MQIEPPDDFTGQLQIACFTLIVLLVMVVGGLGTLAYRILH